MKQITLILTIALVLAGCTPPTAAPAPTSTPTPIPSPTSTPIPTLSPELQTYLDEALDLIQENSLYSASGNWTTLRTWAYESVVEAQSTADLYPAILMVLGAIGDRHGYVMPPGDAEAYFEAPTESIPAIQHELLQDQLGHIIVPSFLSGNNETVLQFSGQIRAAIQNLDALGACGWIVDLRYNDGGNGFAMLAGLASLLGDGVYGYNADANGDLREWRYKAGKMYLGEILIVELPNPYQTQNSGAPIAVLTSELTTSAGELVAIAFRGWPNTRSFGQETLGRTTGPEGFYLSDGAILGISTIYFSDKTGRVYIEGISPDEYIFEEKGPLFRDRSVPQQAIDWMLSQPACAGE